MNLPSSPTPNRFADYFVISGLDLGSGLEPDRVSGDNLQSTPLDRSYRSQVLAHYPDNVPWNPFEKDAVSMLCLPQGLQFRTQKHAAAPQFHSFVLTREDGSRTYGFSLVFYEEIRNRKICSAMQTLQAMHLTEVSSNQSAGQRGRKPGASGAALDSHNTRSLPRHFKLSAHHPGAALSYFDAAKDTLYVSKSIALICQLPYLRAARKFLHGIYRCSACASPTEPSPLSAESYVHHLLYEVSAPQPGRSLMFSCAVSPGRYEPVLLQRPGSIEELPLYDFSMKELFTLLGVEAVIQLFTCVLLENQVLLVSADYQLLMVVSESIVALLFPFSWQHVYVPVLPVSMQHFLDAPVPFVMGLHSCESNLKIASEANLCYVDIDNRSVQLPEELPIFPQRHDLAMELLELLAKHRVQAAQPDRNCNNEDVGSSRLRPSGLLPQNRLPSSLNSSSTLPSRLHLPRRKHSWSHDADAADGVRSTQSDALQKMVALVRNTGVSMDDLDGNSVTRELTESEQYAAELKFNNAVREVFLNRFVHIFSAYEHFIIQPNQGQEEWLSSRDSMQNFDKATYLSDQPEPHLPFLSRFIETQMFATLVDNKIMAAWQEMEPNLRVFDRRIKLFRKRFGDGLVRTPGYEPCTTIRDSERLLEQRLASVDVTVQPPHEIMQPPPTMEQRGGNAKPTGFPLLDSVLLNKEPAMRSRVRRCNNAGGVQWRHRKEKQGGDDNSAGEAPAGGNAAAVAAAGPESLKGVRQPKLSSVMSPADIAHTNWSFVEKLLKDCKSKTKRMLVQKMGNEAVELGHGGEVSVGGVEENTLIASLCDLLERIWSHALQNKQGKSALWSHLTNYQELEECNDTSKPIDPSFLTPACPASSKFVGLPGLLITLKWKNIYELASYLNNKLDLSSMALETDLSPRPHPRGRERIKSPERRRSPADRKLLDRSNGGAGVEQPVLRPLPVSLTFDMRHVQSMSDIKTHIGYARAWVRLSLEKKLLSRHLRGLLSDSALLRSQYKRSAFLRCEDEKEQFLYHLLTLNAVDYFCFTNTYTNTKLPYRVVIFPSRKASAATTTANSWVALSGTLGETAPVPIPRGTLEFVFHHKNLGVLTSLRIGHDNSGLSPKWLVEHIVVRNEVTAHMYKFPCGRWLGRGIDDGSLERLLVGEMVPRHVASEDLVEACQTPPRCRSPSVPRRSNDLRPSIPDIQHLLGDAVNNIVKLYYRRQPDKERSSLTVLLCGELGLVYCLEQVFLSGFKSARLFGRNLYIWDYFVRAKEQFEMRVSGEGDPTPRESHPEDGQEDADVIRCYCYLVEQIQSSSHTLGKDGKFQLFVCLSARERILHRMLPSLAASRITAEMYEEQSFLRNPTLLTFLGQILESLDEFDIVLENSITQGIAQ